MLFFDAQTTDARARIYLGARARTHTQREGKRKIVASTHSHTGLEGYTQGQRGMRMTIVTAGHLESCPIGPSRPLTAPPLSCCMSRAERSGKCI